MHICTEMYSNVLQRIGEPWNPEELMLVCVSYISSEMVWLMDMKTDCSLLATK